MVVSASPVAVTQTSDFAPALSKEFLDTQATIVCGFTLKRLCDMTRTYSLVCLKYCILHLFLLPLTLFFFLSFAGDWKQLHFNCQKNLSFS